MYDEPDDAINTALLMEKIELDPEFQLASYELPEEAEDVSCVLAEMMAKLQFEIEEP